MTKHFVNKEGSKYETPLFWQYRKNRKKDEYYHQGKPQNARWFYTYPKIISTGTFISPSIKLFLF